MHATAFSVQPVLRYRRHPVLLPHKPVGNERCKCLAFRMLKQPTGLAQKELILGASAQMLLNCGVSVSQGFALFLLISGNTART